MRGQWVVAIVAAGCAGDEPGPGARQAYETLRDRTEIECGAYEDNTTIGKETVPRYLCGAQPDVACINAAIAGTRVAHLRYLDIDPNTQSLRDHDYFAGDGKLVWIGLIEAGGIPAWYQSECGTLVAESFEAAGTTCWKLHADACVRQ